MLAILIHPVVVDSADRIAEISELEAGIDAVAAAVAVDAFSRGSKSESSSNENLEKMHPVEPM